MTATVLSFNVHATVEGLEPFLNSLVPWYVWQCRALGLQDIPAHVQYEPESGEVILLVEEILRIGRCDCEDMSILRCALILMRGGKARVSVIQIKPGELHARVICETTPGVEIVIDDCLKRGMAKYYDAHTIKRILTP